MSDAPRPTVMTLHDRVSELEALVFNLKRHIEGSLGFEVHGRPSDAPSEPDSESDGPAALQPEVVPGSDA